MNGWRIPFCLLAVTTLTAWGERARPNEWPHAGPMPDDPVKFRPFRYDPVTKGNQGYRPVDPMPWADVNKRVAPKSAPADAAPTEKKSPKGAQP